VRFASRALPNQQVSFQEALFAGLAPDGGLYHPVEHPDLETTFASIDDGSSFQDVAVKVCSAALAPEIDEKRARSIAARAFGFAPLLRRIDERVLLLELFHGPTCAFKDFGAGFLAAAMEDFIAGENRRIQILVATSGDTGSAVAHAFHGRRNIDVVILYPSGRVSRLQEQQLTTLGGNVHALEVEGAFDDCQRMAKEAFQDPALRARLSLTSANSINIGRLLPQCLYYAFAATRRNELGGEPGGVSPTICVPSGNFGNLTAGMYAWRWGLPVRRFIAATNSNDVVPAYLETGSFDPRVSTPTISNAMDVGNPSNFERLEELFKGDWRAMAASIEGRAVSDRRTRETMRRIHREHGVLVDPHTAVGLTAAADHLAEADRAGGRGGAGGSRGAEQIIVLSTAHPGKFSDIVLDSTGVAPRIPERLARCMGLPKQATRVGPRLGELSRFLLDSFA
jgi:threonine synthase